MATQQHHHGPRRQRARANRAEGGGATHGDRLGSANEDQLAWNLAALGVLACSEEPVENKAQVVAQFVHGSVDKCDGAVVTLRSDGLPAPAAGASQTAHDLDTAQYRAGRGPCLEAMGQLQVFAVGYLPDASYWPELRQAAEDRKVTSCLSVPLVAGGRTLGALTLYSHRRDAFVENDQTALSFAAAAAAALAGARGEDGPY